MAESPDEITSLERQRLRREEDQQAAEYIANTLRWVQRGPRILILLFGAMTGAAGTGAWIGTQAGDVTQDDIKAVNMRIDTLQLGLNLAKVTFESAKVEQNEKLDVLLRLSCPKITRADLVKACREQGITR